MEGHAKHDVERYCELTIKNTDQMVCIWHEWEDLTFFGPYTNLPEQSQYRQELVTDVWKD